MELTYQCNNNENFHFFDKAIMSLRGNNDVLNPIIFYLDYKSLSAKSIYFLLIICCLLGFISAFFTVYSLYNTSLVSDCNDTLLNCI